MACNSCDNSATRVMLPTANFSEKDYVTIKQALQNIAKYILIQAEGTILSIRWQRRLLESAVIKNLTPTVIYSGNSEIANALHAELHKHGINSYIQESNKLL